MTWPQKAYRNSKLSQRRFDKRRFLDLIRDFIVFGETGKQLQARFSPDITSSTPSATPLPGPSRPRARGRPQGGRHLAHARLWQEPSHGLLRRADHQASRHGKPHAPDPHRPQRPRRPAFGTFSMCKDLLRQTPQQAEDRDELRKLLDRPSGGVIFTTIQKFSPADGETDHPLLTDRRNVVVIADEAHRSQYGFQAKLNRKTGEISYGFAKYLRDALPNASFIGFTGTPIEKDDINTPAVFGEYIDVYDISRAVEDGATVPIYYESRVARIEIDEDEKPKIDAEIAEITEDEAADRTGAPQTQVGERGGAGRRRQTPRDDCRGPRPALRGAHRRPRRQGNDRLHEPPHLRRAL